MLRARGFESGSSKVRGAVCFSSRLIVRCLHCVDPGQQLLRRALPLPHISQDPPAIPLPVPVVPELHHRHPLRLLRAVLTRLPHVQPKHLLEQPLERRRGSAIAGPPQRHGREDQLGDDDGARAQVRPPSLLRQRPREAEVHDPHLQLVGVRIHRGAHLEGRGVHRVVRHTPLVDRGEGRDDPRDGVAHEAVPRTRAVVPHALYRRPERRLTHLLPPRRVLRQARQPPGPPGLHRP
mmetsp:Transcript_10567/g.25911  ORF Transcript_10567/g.25911 Transcript_10567/m.25911 type:complete len:236 (-) Transcript_10567:706-1413(-)